MSLDAANPNSEFPEPSEPNYVSFKDLGITDDSAEEGDALASNNIMFASVGSIIKKGRDAFPGSKAGTAKTSLLGIIGQEVDLDASIPDYVPGWKRAARYRAKIATLVNYVTKVSLSASQTATSSTLCTEKSSAEGLVTHPRE